MQASNNQRINVAGVDFGPSLVTTTWVAVMAGVSSRTVERWCNQGMPHHRRPGPGSRRYLEAGALLAWLMGPAATLLLTGAQRRELIDGLHTAVGMALPAGQGRLRRSLGLPAVAPPQPHAMETAA